MALLNIQQLRILSNPGNFFRVQKACFKSENMAQSPEQQQWTGVYQDSKVLCKVVQSLKNLCNKRFIQMKTFKMRPIAYSQIINLSNEYNWTVKLCQNDHNKHAWI